MKRRAPLALAHEPAVIREEWYRAYYTEKGAERNSLLVNPGVLFQNLAQDAALVRAIRCIDPDLQTARVLDVGCGGGASLVNLVRLGFLPVNLFGIDFQQDRIFHAKERCAGMNLTCADATRMEFPSESFDLVSESTLFIHTVEDRMSERIASEMLRVTRPNGHLLLTDWRFSKPGSNAHKGLSQKRINGLFHVGTQTRRLGVFRGPLIPPVGRFLSAHLPSMYFLVQRLFPVLVGQTTTVLQKI